MNPSAVLDSGNRFKAVAGRRETEGSMDLFADAIAAKGV